MYPPTPALLAPHPPMLPIHPPMLSHPPMLPMLAPHPPMLPMLAPHPPMLPMLAPYPPIAAYVSSSSSNAAYVSSSSTNATYAPAYVSSSSTNASHPIAILPATMIPSMVHGSLLAPHPPMVPSFGKAEGMAPFPLAPLTVVLAVGFLVDAEAKPAPSPMVLPYGVPDTVLPGMLGAPVAQPMSPMMYPPTPALLAPHPPMLPIHRLCYLIHQCYLFSSSSTNAAYVSSSSPMLPVSSSSTNASYAPAYVSSSSPNASHPIAILPAPMIPSMVHGPLLAPHPRCAGVW
nr:vegetative cell wall protein gp1-like [Penaeus vannamei]